MGAHGLLCMDFFAPLWGHRGEMGAQRLLYTFTGGTLDYVDGTATPLPYELYIQDARRFWRAPAQFARPHLNRGANCAGNCL